MSNVDLVINNHIIVRIETLVKSSLWTHIDQWVFFPLRNSLWNQVREVKEYV